MIQHWTELGSLWNAARRAARGKRHRPSVAKVLFDLEGTVLRLRRELRDGTWQPGIPQAHAIRDPKPRIIHAAPFADRIVHQALCAAIGPLLDRGLIEHSYACRVGKGTHAALRQARLWARSYSHFVHLDVVKFFPSLDHAILLAQLERVIPCEATRAICERIVQAWRGPGVRFYFPGDDLFTPYGRTVGLPIGNLTSQHFANRYLSPVDHRAKDRLRIRPYLRYMDDMLFFGNDRSQLQDWAHELEDACYRQRARLHPCGPCAEEATRRAGGAPRPLPALASVYLCTLGPRHDLETAHQDPAQPGDPGLRPVGP